MSRLLFSFMGGHGHFVPLVPVARAAQNAGHDVAFACGPSRVAAVEADGFVAYPLEAAASSSSVGPERSPLRPLDPTREDEEFRDRFAGAAPRHKAPRLRAFCETWRPDVVVCDEADFGSLLAAEQLGLPYVSVNVMAAGSFVRPSLISGVLNDVRAEMGLLPDPTLAMLSRYLVLSPFPIEFRDPAHPLPPTGHGFRPFETSAVPTAPVRWPGQRVDAPLVYFSLGTVFNTESGDLFARVLAGLSRLPINLLVTVGHDIDPAELGPQPGHIRIERYVPQQTVLPHCSLIVSHGGSGSVAGALAHGVPMLLIPMGADQPQNAWRSEALGLGRWLDPLAASADDVASCATQLLAEPAFRQTADRFRTAFSALPGPDDALRLIERLIATRSPIFHR